MSDVETVAVVTLRSLGTNYDTPEEVVMFELTVILSVLGEAVALASEEGHHDLPFLLHGQVSGKTGLASWSFHVSCFCAGKA